MQEILNNPWATALGLAVGLLGYKFGIEPVMLYHGQQLIEWIKRRREARRGR